MGPHDLVVGQKVDEEKVRRAKELRKTMTPEERILWEQIRDNRLNGLHFRRQQVIDGFIVDFYCHALGLVIEVDGGIHRGQAEYDAARDQILLERGLQILRVQNTEVRSDMSRLLARIEALVDDKVQE